MVFTAIKDSSWNNQENSNICNCFPYNLILFKCKEKLLFEATGCHGIQKRRREGNQSKVGYQTYAKETEECMGLQEHNLCNRYASSVPVASTS